MEATPNSTRHEPRKPESSVSTLESAFASINDAANAKHAIEATATALSDLVYAKGDFEAIGMYEALCFSIAALDRAVGDAMDKVGQLRDSASPNRTH